MVRPSTSPLRIAQSKGYGTVKEYYSSLSKKARDKGYTYSKTPEGRTVVKTRFGRTVAVVNPTSGSGILARYGLRKPTISKSIESKTGRTIVKADGKTLAVIGKPKPSGSILQPGSDTPISKDTAKYDKSRIISNQVVSSHDKLKQATGLFKPIVKYTPILNPLYTLSKDYREPVIEELEKGQAELIKYSKKDKTKTQQRIAGMGEFGIEVVKFPFERPYVTGALVSAPIFFPSLAPVIGVGVGVPTTVTGVKGIIQAPTEYERGKAIGQTMIGSLATYGGVAGIYPKVSGFFRTIGKTEIPVEQLTRESILTGKQRFPTAPTKSHLEQFKESKYKLPGEDKPGLWHATPEGFGKDVTIKGSKSELPGLYGSSEVSVHFLKLQEPKYSMGGKLIPEFVEPGIIRVTPKDIRTRPAGKTKGGYDWISGKSEPGVADIPGIKTEIEAILPPGTRLLKIEFKYYTKYKGTRVPIYKYKVVDTAGNIKTITGANVNGKIITPSQLSSYYKQVEVSSLPVISSGVGLTSYKSKPSSSFITSGGRDSKIAPSSSPIISKGISSSITPPKSYKSTVGRGSSSSMIGSSSSFVSSGSSSYVGRGSSGSSIGRTSSSTTTTRRRDTIRSIKRKLEKRRTKGFETFIKKSGKWLQLSSRDLTRSQAIKLGEKYTRKTLGATFGVKESGKWIEGVETGYAPRQDVFRSYQVRKGLKKPMKDVWIQRRKYRLGTRSEVGEIMSAKRSSNKKKGGFKWF